MKKNLPQDLVKIGEASKILGVSIDTLRRWGKADKIQAIRTPGGTRLYDANKLRNIVGEKETPVELTETDAASVWETTEDLLKERQTPLYKQQSADLPTPQPVQIITKKLSELEEVDQLPHTKHVFRPIMVVSILILLLTTASTLYIIRPHFIKGAISSLDEADFQSEDLRSSKVLAVSTLAKFGEYLEVNADTNITGNLAVEGEGIFKENVTAPNLVYTLTAGSGISVTGGQSPSITSTDTLALVTGRGATTTTALTLSGAVTLGNVLNLGRLSSAPSSAVNGAMYYNTTDNKFKCYKNGSWVDCDTDTDTTGGSMSSFTLAGTSGTSQTISDSNTLTIAAGNGLTTTAGATDTVTVGLDVTTTGTTSTTSANSGLETSTVGLSLLRGCSNNQALIWDTATSTWTCGSPTGIISVQESGVVILPTADTINFEGGDFDFTTTGSNVVNAQLATQLTTPTGVAGNWDVAGQLVVGTGNAVTITAAGEIQIPAAQTLQIGAIELNDVGTSSITTGSILVGVYGTNIPNATSATNVQEALEALGSAIGGAGGSKWTDGGTFTYLTASNDDLVLGGTTVAGASLFFDEDASNLYLGTNESANGILTLYSSGPGVTDPTITTNITGQLIIDSTNFDVTATGINGAAIGASTPSTGAFTTLSANSTVTFSSLSTGIAHLNGSGVVSSSAVNLASSDVTGVLPIANGGTALSSTPTNGQLLIGNGTGYTLATLTDGTGISITEGSGTITIANSGVTSLTGTTNR
ncbi:MAG: helix-turn-helix domain-containing protein, partial [Candidatus Daviesbacteria bacterium]